MVVFIFIVVHWYLSLFFQTFFLHRYAAHKMFSMSRFWEKVFFVLSFLTQGSSYLSPYAYGVMHRMHHAHTDTEDDPHSPSYDRNLMAMMWRTKVIYYSIFKKELDVEERFKKGVPEWRGFDKYAHNYITRVLWMAIYTTVYVYIATEWWMFLFLPLHFVMGPLHGAIINWFAHKYGYRNFNLEDTSMNFLPVDFLMMGESYHNNHHKFGSNPNFGFKWFEIDPVYPIIKLFDKLKIIQLKTLKV